MKALGRSPCKRDVSMPDRPRWWWGLVALAVAGFVYLGLAPTCQPVRGDTSADPLLTYDLSQHPSPASRQFVVWLKGGDKFAPGFAPSATYAIADYLWPRDLTLSGTLAILSGSMGLPSYAAYEPDWGLYLPWVADAVARTWTPWNIAFAGE